MIIFSFVFILFNKFIMLNKIVKCVVAKLKKKKLKMKFTIIAHIITFIKGINIIISLSFMKEFKTLCNKLEIDVNYAIENIVEVLANYKIKILHFEDNYTNKIIKECLLNNTDPLMRGKINAVTYAGNIIVEVLT